MYYYYYYYYYTQLMASFPGQPGKASTLEVKPVWTLKEARDRVLGWQWHQLDHMQT